MAFTKMAFNCSKTYPHTTFFVELLKSSSASLILIRISIKFDCIFFLQLDMPYFFYKCI